MKTISLSVVGVAESDADANDKIAAEVADKVSGTTAAARALVGALQQAGVRIQTASVTFAPRPGSHEAAETVDLTAEEPAAESAPQAAEPEAPQNPPPAGATQ